MYFKLNFVQRTQRPLWGPWLHWGKYTSKLGGGGGGGNMQGIFQPTEHRKS